MLVTDSARWWPDGWYGRGPARELPPDDTRDRRHAAGVRGIRGWCHDRNRDGYGCTLHAGHEGAHAAGDGTYLCATWERGA